MPTSAARRPCVPLVLRPLSHPPDTGTADPPPLPTRRLHKPTSARGGRAGAGRGDPLAAPHEDARLPAFPPRAACACVGAACPTSSCGRSGVPWTLASNQ